MAVRDDLFGARAAGGRAASRAFASTSRLALAGLLTAGVVSFATSAFAANFDVADSSQLSAAINNAAPGDTITFTQNITLTGPLPQVTKNVTINGGGYQLNGQNTYQGFVVTSGTVAINNLSITQTRAQGGNGGNSYYQVDINGISTTVGGGGGGGAGLGGALFVGPSANVTVTNVTFQNNQAVGGSGGSTNLAGVTTPGGGGGGGRFGNGDSSSSGGGASGGAGGGGQGANSGGTPAQAGGFGGGGGGASPAASTGAAGGFGGGGGGGALGGAPGQGGWGGSAGSEYFAPNGETGSGNGGNGAGLGGAVFVQEGGTLTFGGTLAVASNTVTGGIRSSLSVASGRAAGSGLFLQGNGSFTFDPGANQTQTVSDIIADQTGVSGSGGSWSIVKTGAGTTILTGNQQYSGGITIDGGVLRGTVSSLKGNIVDNAALEIVETGTANLSNAVSGNGSVTKLGAGTLSLTGNMSYTGLTFVNEGTLLVPDMPSTVFLNGGTIGARSGTSLLSEAVIAGGGGASITSQAGNPLTISGPISGSNWNKIGDGNLTLTGTNSFTGLNIASGQVIVATEANLGQSNGTITLGGGNLEVNGSGVTFHQNLVLNSGRLNTGGSSLTWGGAISGTGSLVKSGSGVLQLTGNNTYSGGTAIDQGTLWVASDSALGTGGITLASGTLRTSGTFATARAIAVNGSGSISVDASQTLTLNGVVSGESLAKLDTGTLVLNGANTFTQLVVNAGRVIGNSNSIRGNTTMTSLGAVTFDQSSDGTYAGNISGLGSLTKTGGGKLILTGFSTYSGATVVEDGWLQGNTNSLRGDISVDANGTVAFDQAFDGYYGGDLTGTGQLYKIGAGNLSAMGDIDVGATTVSGGTLSVNGTLTSPNIYVSSGARLGGSGTIVGNVVNTGGIAPGNSIGTLTIDGALAIHGGSLDMQIGPGGENDKIIVTGPDGVVTFGVNTLNLIFEPGAVYAPTTYTLVTASQGLEGTIDTLSAEEHPANFTAYAYNTATEVLLTLTAELGNESPLAPNQAAVAQQLDAIYNGAGELPPGFADLYGLSGGALNNAMSTVMGEAATGLRPTAVQMTNTFLQRMLDPFVDGRSGTAGISQSPALGYAVLPAGSPAMDRKAPGAAGIVQPSWAAWGSVFGGAGRIDGDSFGTGSHDVSTHEAGVIGGLDYRLSPDTVVGFALGGAGGNWSMADGVGGGDTDAFEVGLYGVTHWGAAYLGGALSFTNHWASTERAAFDQKLTADFEAQSYGGRIEGGYRFETANGAFTPYAAGQVQSLSQPSFTDGGGVDPGLAATFASNTADNGRAELGLRYDISRPIGPDMTLAFQTRLAWAHDWFSDGDLSATFESLPISYVVAGATPAHDLALISAGAELRLDNGLSLAATFDAELSDSSTFYTGTGMVQYKF